MSREQKDTETEGMQSIPLTCESDSLPLVAVYGEYAWRPSRHADRVRPLAPCYTESTSYTSEGDG